MKRFYSIIVILFCVLAAVTSAPGQSNLLFNSNADDELEHWTTFMQAAIEEWNEDKVFVVRSGGYFVQDVTLTETGIGKFALFIGRGASERVNPDGAITGLPYLYGYMIGPGEPAGERIYAYLQGQKMLGDVRDTDEWVTMFGIFQVPEATRKIRFFLNQAERRGVPHNGSAARFDNLGLYLFETEEEALKFVKKYNNEVNKSLRAKEKR